MRRLIPCERQIVLTDFRGVERIRLIVQRNVSSPEIEGIAAVEGAGLEIDPVEERRGRNLAVFLELGAAVRLRGGQETFCDGGIDRAGSAGRCIGEAEPARWPVEYKASPRLKPAVVIPADCLLKVCDADRQIRRRRWT